MVTVVVKSTYEAGTQEIISLLEGRYLQRKGNEWRAKFWRRLEAAEAVQQLRLLHGVQAWIEEDGQPLPKAA